MSNPPLAILGHSHAVALLDGISTWRESVSMEGQSGDNRYGAAFQGWFDSDLSKNLIELQANKGFEWFKGTKVCLMTGATDVGHLATINREKGDSPTITPSPFLERFANGACNARAIVSLIYGNQHSVATMIKTSLHTPEYDFIESPGERRVDVMPRPIDIFWIDTIVSDWVTEVIYPLFVIKHITKLPVLHVLPPPPLENPSEASVPEAFGELAQQHGFLQAGLRIKWYKRYCKLLTEKLMSAGIVVIPSPPEVTTADGFLLPEYAEGMTHGNALYGKAIAPLIIDKLENVV